MAKKQKDKVENLTEQYQYKGEGEHISDISASKPLKTKSKPKLKPKKEEVKEEVKEVEEIKEIIEPIIEPVIEKLPSKKDMYLSMILENRPFILKVNGSIVFDSEQSSIMNLCFEDTHFRIGFEKHSYDGLNFKFKK
jgi:hypothetical protein